MDTDKKTYEIEYVNLEKDDKVITTTKQSLLDIALMIARGIIINLIFLISLLVLRANWFLIASVLWLMMVQGRDHLKVINLVSNAYSYFKAKPTNDNNDLKIGIMDIRFKEGEQDHED